jgi:hypothetical protein
MASSAETASSALARLSEQPELALPEVFRRVCETAAETLRIERAGIWLFVNGDKILRCVSLFERSKRKHAKGACLSLSECPSFLRSIAGVALLPCESARTDPRTAELSGAYLAPLGIASVLYAPLQRDGRPIGMLFFEHKGSPRDWSDPDRTFALSVADLVVDRIKAAEGALKTAPRTHFVVVPPAVPAPLRLAHDLKEMLNEIEVLARTNLKAGAGERLSRIAEKAARGLALLHGLFETETAEHETVPDSLGDDTDEHPALPTSAASGT